MNKVFVIAEAGVNHGGDISIAKKLIDLASEAGADAVKSPLPGVVNDILVKIGDTVNVGQTVLILEAMKMENNINAIKSGKVTAIKVNKGDSVLEGTELIIIE